MDIQNFIENFADQFDETDFCEFKPDTVYRDLEEWSSLTGLAILNMISKKYGVKLSSSDVKNADTIESLYNLVISKKA